MENYRGTFVGQVFWRLFFLVLLGMSFLSDAQALNESPQTFTLDGRLYQAGGSQPLLDPNVKFKVQILNPSGTCLLYEEEQFANTFSSEGYFHVNVGSAVGSSKRTVSDPGRTMNQIFQNTAGISANDVPGKTCAGGAYTPVAGAIRYFRVTVTPSTTNVADTLKPDIVIDSVPMAMVAQSVQGLEKANILQTAMFVSSSLTQTNLESLFIEPAYSNLQTILAGDFLRVGATGVGLPSFASNPSSPAVGDVWFDSTTGQIKYQNGSGVQTVGAAGGGTISSLTVGSSMSLNGTVAGTISSGAGAIDLTDTGVSAGAYSKVTVDTKGRVIAGAVSLNESDIPNLTVAGKVSGNAITAGTISGSTAVNTSGNLISTGTVSGLTVQATNLRVYNGPNYIQLSAPVLSGNVNLTLPVDDGNAGEVLSTDGSGNLSWVSTLGSSLASGKIWVGNSSNVATAVSLSGDASLSNAGVLTLENTGVGAGTYTKVTVDTKGRVTTAANITSSDVTTALGYAPMNAVSGFVDGGNSFGADATLGTNDNKALNFKVNNTTAVTISQNGNVGIGVTNPTAPLSIGSAGTQYLTVDNLGSISSYSGNNVGLTLYSGSAGYKGLRMYTATEGRIEFGSGQAGDPWDTRLDHSAAKTLTLDDAAGGAANLNVLGKIGIATSTPSAALDVSGAFNMIGIAAPGVSASNEGRIYYDRSANKFKISQNGAAYVDLIGAGSVTSIGGQSGAAQSLVISVDNSVATPTIASASDTHTWKIPMASNTGTTAGLLSKTDYDAFNTKLGASTSFAGDVSGAYNATVVQKIQGKAVAAASADKQIMIYNGTSWVNSVVSGDATLSNAGILTVDSGATANKIVRLDSAARMPAVDGSALTSISAANISGTLSLSKGGTAATSLGAGSVIVSNTSGSALQALNCTGGQIITFDTMGYAICGSIGATGFVNGGNSFGADATLGTNDNKALNFEVNNTTAMTISQNGYLGIGTTNPAFKLEVDAGQVASRNYNGWGGFYAYSARGTQGAPTATLNGDWLGSFGMRGYGTTGWTSGSVIGAYASEDFTDTATGSDMAFKTVLNGTVTQVERMRITNAGTVGIGVADPTLGDSNLSTYGWNVLTVAATPISGVGAAALTLANQRSSLAAGDRVGAVHFVNTNNGSQKYTGFINVGLAGSGGANGFAGQMSFYTKADNSTAVPQRMIIDQNGNVGIATSTPAFKLDVNGTVNSTGSYVVQGNKGFLTYYNVGAQTIIGDNTAVWDNTIRVGADTQIWNGGSARMTVLNGGNVGIGTSSPAHTLDVNGIASFSSYTVMNGTGYSQILLNHGAGGWGFIGNNSPGVWSLGYTNTGSTAMDHSVIAWNNSGNVGIGTSGPGYKLDVQGGDINASGSVRAAGVALTSDERFKKDIKTLDFSLEKILSIRGVEYNWRQNEFPDRHFNDRHQIGVIAQEVEKVYPEVVDTNKDGYKSVNYPALVAPLIEAVKSIYRDIVGVQAGLAEADAKIQKLEAENAALKSYLCGKDPAAAICK